ncbi:hypothetical protein BEN30_13875 [Magnetovibrio blakemorei]|uniref:Cadherin domain-containing protein n=2 Tax=Magnetovibrio blakemorei TaxID=28181 RepID=A0A1E5Q5F2_9PROT|nr:hypothetical protein BEN30_13875 [Magnetovibrio blakemorei]
MISTFQDGAFVHAHPLDAINSQGNLLLPSGENFLRADFVRNGPDLLIQTPSGSQYLAPDFFMAETPPALITSDGAVLSAKLVTTLAGPVAPGQVAQLGFGAPTTQQDAGLGVPIGQVNEAEGQVTVTHPDGTQETLLTGGSVFQGDVLQTAAGASVSVIFVDDTVFSLAEDGRMVLDEMVYDASAQTGVFKAEVVQGVFSFVSGQVAKTSPDGMVVSTPTTTIGIRGSTVLGNAAAEGAENKITLVPDVDGKVGEIVINTGGGSIVLNSAGATTTVFSANGAPSTVVVLSQAAIQKSFGATLTKLVKVVAQKAEADASRAAVAADAKSAEAKQADAEAKQAGETAQKADEAAQQADAEAAQAEADAAAAEAEAAAAKAEAEASGDPEAKAKADAAEAKAAEAKAQAEAAKAQAEAQAAEAAKAQAEAQAKTAAAETKAAEAQAAVAQAEQAQQFNTLAKSAEATQTKAFETAQKAEADAAATAQKADTADTAQKANASDTQNNDGNDGTGQTDAAAAAAAAAEADALAAAAQAVAEALAEAEAAAAAEAEAQAQAEAAAAAAKAEAAAQAEAQAVADAQAAADAAAAKAAEDNTPAANQAPEAEDTSNTTIEDDRNPISGTVTAADPEGGTITYSLGTYNAAHAMVTMDSDGTYTYIPEVDYFGTDTFTYIATDSGGLTATGTVTVEVTGVNDEPVAGGTKGDTLLVGGTIIFQTSHLNATDVDNIDSSLIYSIVSVPTAGSVMLNNEALVADDTFTQADVDAGNVKYVQDGSQSSTDMFIYTVTDNDITTAEQTFTLTIVDFLTIAGTTGDDVIVGSMENDFVSGDLGSDTITGGEGDDFIDGGAGTDTAILSGAMANYTMSFAEDGTLIMFDTVGSDGIDILTSIETISFSDGDITVANLSGERLVNTTTTGNQTVSKSTDLNDGGSIVSWYDADTSQVFMQRYDAAGTPVGGETQITSSALANTWYDIEAFDNGGYGVSWTNGLNVYANLYDVNDAQVGATITLNTADADQASITQTYNDGFLATYVSTDGDASGIYGRFFDSTGTALTNPFAINAVTTADQLFPRSATLNNGNVVVSWISSQVNAPDTGVYARIVKYDGTAVQYMSGELLVQNNGALVELGHSLTSLDDGGFAIAWLSGTTSTASPTTTFDIFVQCYDETGTVKGSIITVGSLNAISAYNDTAITALENGGFVVTWTNEATSGDFDIMAQIYDVIGDPVGVSFTVNTTTAGIQSQPSVVATPDGGFVVSWNSTTAGNDDIYTQRFDAMGIKLGYTSLTGDAGNNTFNITPGDALLDINGLGGTDAVILGGTSIDTNFVKITEIETITGGDARDLVLMGNTINDTLTVDLGAGIDTVKLADGGNTNSFTNVEDIIGGNGDDVITLLNTFTLSDKASFSGELGVDTLNLADGGNEVEEIYGFETIYGGSGSDVISSIQSVDLKGSAVSSIEIINIDTDDNGQDVLHLNSATSFTTSTTVNGSTAGNDVIGSDDGMNLTNLIVGSGIEAIMLDWDVDDTTVLTIDANTLASAGSLFILGNGGNDSIALSGTGAFDFSTDILTNISAISGDDSGQMIIGSADDNYIVLGNGNNTVVGGDGQDTLTGGTGTDIFAYSALTETTVGSGDIITNFDAGTSSTSVDVINLMGLLTGTFAWLGSSATAFTGGNSNTEARFDDGSKLLEIDTDGDGTADMGITLTNVDIGNLDSSDFTFV